MDKNEYRKNAYNMIELTVCAINGSVPDKSLLDNIDRAALFEVCETHILTACVSYALESAGLKYDEFSEAKNKAIRKNIILDTERKKILAELEKEGIWYMPLKGALLKDWYPKLGMRQMSDNDILCDNNARDRIKDIMLGLGFTCDKFGKSVDDTYLKEPVSNFEMHGGLFPKGDFYSALTEYYSNVKERLIKDDKNSYGYHFSNEDFYIYMIAHEFKHYSEGGTGVRSLVDIYVFHKKFGKVLDMDYIQRELSKMSMDDFERGTRELAFKLFERAELSDAEKAELDYYILSGTYGVVAHKGQNMAERNLRKEGYDTGTKYLLKRIFPPMEQIKESYPFYYRHKLLIPFLWIKRGVKFIFVGKVRKRIIAEFNYLHDKKNKK